MINPIRAVVFAVVTSLVLPALGATCGCGPDFCTNDTRIASHLADKKREMAKDYPLRLVALLDKGPQCVARIDREPDIFSFVFVQADGSIITHPWSKDDEVLAHKQLASGDLKRYWIVNGRRAFSCCDEPNFDKMDDYDAHDDVNASRAIKCIKGSTC